MSQSTLHTGRLLLLLAGIAAFGPAIAQTSGDPTKPPTVWLAMQPKPPGAAAAAAVEAEGAGTPGAQIIVVGPARKFAMVDGHAVRPGETYKGSKLLSIGPNAVTWQTEGRREVTSMSPGVQKTDPAVRQSKQSGAKAGTKN